MYCEAITIMLANYWSELKEREAKYTERMMNMVVQVRMDVIGEGTSERSSWNWSKQWLWIGGR